MAQLRHWCKGEGIDPEYAILVKNVPEEVEVNAIEETLQSIKALGRVKVRGRMYDPQTQRLTVLCECRQKVNAKACPLDVLPEGSDEPWRIFGPSEEENEPQNSGNGGNPFVDSGQDSPFRTSTPEAIIRAVGEVLQMTNPRSGSEGSSYRRLRTFSGVQPTPPGEETLENWIEQARLMIEESERPEREMKMRVMESVKGPALEILQAVRFNNHDATAMEYLEILESTFGTSETGEDLYFTFRQLCQQPNEKLSEFLRRMERVLNKVVKKGGLQSATANQARIDQLIKGGTRSDLMMLNLRLRERRQNPPPFLQLLNEIRHEEEHEASRRRLQPPKAVYAKSTIAVPDKEVIDLKAEIQGLRTQVSELTISSFTPSAAAATSEQTVNPPKVTVEDKSMRALREEVRELREQVSVLSLRPSYSSTTMSHHDEVKSNSVSQRPFTPRDSSDFFCYRCGEDGHFATKCTAPENYPKVIQKLIQVQRKQRTNQKQNSNTRTKPTNVDVKRSAIMVETSGLPEGLIGPPSLAEVKINGKICNALMDSGSQITIIFDSFYSEHLSHVPLHPVTGLSIWGLSESKSGYPYKGYIHIDLELPRQSEAEKIKSVPVLALVCPDPRCSETVPVLVGTNVKGFQPINLNPEVKGSEQVHSARVQVQEQSSLPAHKPQLAKDIKDLPVADVKWTGPGPLIIPAGTEHIAICKVKENRTVGDSILITERAASPALPPSVLVQPTVLFSKMLDKNSFLVLLRNESLKQTAIPLGTIIAHLYVVDMVMDAPGRKVNAVPPIDPSLFHFGDSSISREWKERLQHQLSQHSNVFSTDEWDVGLAKGVEHHIRLTDSTPFRERSRRIAPADLDDLRRHLQGLLAAGIIKESRSPYASPIVLARKKNGQLRMCVDYRTLNRRTTPDQYTVPRINDALDCLTGSKWFSVLDLRSGYYQIPMAEEDKEKTAFICPLGFYQFERMPQGITGAPATFQRLMEKAVGDMHLLEVIVYLDDLIVFGRTLEEHEERLLKVIARIEEAGLKLSLDKCQFCCSQVTYVGHIVSEHGIATDPKKVEAVTRWKQPTDLSSLQSFLGFCGYYRRFIKNYSIIVRPLTELCKGYPPTQKRSKSSQGTCKTYYKVNEPFGSRWDQSCSEAFHQIIHCLTNAPVLAFADPTKPYTLHIDASLHGLGAVLNQEYPEGLRPVAFASRKLSVSEKNYPVHQLEFLALKWAVVDKFHDYLYGAQFKVQTDNNPLTYILTTARLNATGHRWLSALSTYNFTLQYRLGAHNIDADALSRNPLPAEDKDWQTMPPESVRALCKQVNSQKVCDETITIAESLGVSPDGIPVCYAYPVHLDLGCLMRLSHNDIIQAQDADPTIAPIKRSLCQGIPFSPGDNTMANLLNREASRLVIKDGLLYRKVKRPSEMEIYQIVLPKEHVSMVLKSLHDESGHLGVEKTLGLIRDRFYWPKMGAEVEQYVRNCGRCVTRKALPQRAAPLKQITSQGPLDLVCIDFLSLESDSQGFSNILVVTDHFTRYAQAFPAKDQTAATVAKILCERYFVHYGLPVRIHSDQGRDFESRLIRDLLKMLGIRKSRTSPYHPQGDPQPERFNRTLLSMLGTLDPKQKNKWSQKISQLVHAYNCTQNEATGYSPYLLMFGREARLPIDICFSVSDESQKSVSYHQYVIKLKKDLERAYDLATETADKNHKRNKAAHDKHVKEQVLEKGDRVLLKNFGVTGKQKLKAKWRPIPYFIVDKLPNLPVYKIKPERGGGAEKTVHRNHLLPIGYLVRLPLDDSGTDPPERCRTRAQQKVGGLLKPSNHEEEMYSESEYEEVFLPKPQGVDLDGLLTHPELSNRISGLTISESDKTRSVQNLRELEAVSSTYSDVIAIPDSTLDPVEEIDIYPPQIPAKRSQRVARPVVRLSYDELGKPSDQAVTVFSHGALVGSGMYQVPRSQFCHTFWCHPMAMCETCSRASSYQNCSLIVVSR